MSTGDSAEMAVTRPAAPSAPALWRHHVRRALVAALAAAIIAPAGLLGVGVAGLGAAPALASGPLVNGGGSSYAAPAINQWAAEEQSINGDTINYNVSSSVIGMNEFAGNQIDFAASEIGYSTGQASSTPTEKYQYLPDVAGATCLMYNLHGVTGSAITVVKLNPLVMSQIFTGQIKFWDDPRIKALNSGSLLPHKPIIVVWRSDASGDNYLFSEYLAYEEANVWNPFSKAMGYQGGANAIFPYPQNGQNPKGYNLTGWVGAQGSDIASNDVAAQEGAITYVETAYAYLHNKPCAYVQNKSGNYVTPTSNNDAVALEGATLLPDLEQQLDGVYSNPRPDTYPISAYSYLITPEATESSQKGAVLGRFILFLACGGQQAAGSLGYSPLPPNLVQDDFDAIDRINGAVKAPATPTAANCKNPYVDGQIPLISGPHQQGGGGGPKGGGPGKKGGGTGKKGGGTGNNGGGTGNNGGGTGNNGGGTGNNGGGTKGGGKPKKHHHVSGPPSSSVPTTTVAGVLSNKLGGPTTTTVTPGLKLLLAVNTVAGSDGPSASTIGLALGASLIVLAAPAVLLSTRRRRRSAKRPPAGGTGGGAK